MLRASASGLSGLACSISEFCVAVGTRVLILGFSSVLAGGIWGSLGLKKCVSKYDSWKYLAITSFRERIWAMQQKGISVGEIVRIALERTFQRTHLQSSFPKFLLGDRVIQNIEEYKRPFKKRVTGIC